MNAMELPNVHPTEDESAEWVVISVLAPVIWELASKNPLWVFKATKYRMNAGQYLATHFSVHYNYELLGTIVGGYISHRFGNGIIISNERIVEGMKRSSEGYKTINPTKAIAKVKSMFKPKSSSEIVAKAYELATQIGNTEHRAKNREVETLKLKHRDAVIAFAMSPAGQELFLDYVKQNNIPDVVRNMHMAETKGVELSTIEDIRTAIGTDRSALVIVDAGKYLVKTGDNVQLYDDNTLPAFIRSKLGLLKLVNPKQFVTDIGCRASNEIFVIKLDKTTKTEGENE